MMLLQLYTVFFATAVAWLNAIPVDKMINYGASIREEKEFHSANAVVKILYIAIMVMVSKNFIAAPLLWLVYWVVFDVAIGILVFRNPFYIGQTAWTDRWLRRLLGNYAGLVKVLVCCSLILVINFFL